MMKEKIEKSTYKLDAAIEKLKRRDDGCEIRSPL